MVGLSSSVDEQIGKDIAMQVAAMNPIALNEDSVPQSIKDNELDIAKDLARQEGKPEEMLERILVVG